MKIKTLGFLSFILAGTGAIAIFLQLLLNSGTNYITVVGSLIIVTCLPLSLSVLLTRFINRASMEAQANMSYLKLAIASAAIGTIMLYTLGYLGVLGYLFWILSTLLGILAVFLSNKTKT